MDEPRLRPEPIGPAELRAETVVLLPYTPFVRKAQTLTASGARGQIPRTIPAYYLRTASLLLVGPVVGAPAAAILMEGLIAGGVREVIVFGVCGSIQETAGIGDVVLVEWAHSAEGTSRHYCPEQSRFFGDAALIGRIRRWLEQGGCPYQAGGLVSTDAPYRETPSFIAECRAGGAVGLDMELSAVYALGQFYGMAAAGLMVVSDELSGGRWRSGFRSDRFRGRCDRILKALVTQGLA